MDIIKQILDNQGNRVYPKTKDQAVFDANGVSLDVNMANKADKSSTVSSVSYDTTNKKITKTINGTTSDVVTAAKIVTDGGGITTHQDISGKADKSTTVSAVAYDTTNHKITKTINGTTTDVVTAETIVNDGGAMTETSYNGRLAANGGSAVIPIGIYIIGRLYDGYEIVSLGSTGHKSLSGTDPSGITYQWDESTYTWTITNTATSGYRYYKCLLRGV